MGKQLSVCGVLPAVQAAPPVDTVTQSAACPPARRCRGLDSEVALVDFVAAGLNEAWHGWARHGLGVL